MKNNVNVDKTSPDYLVRKINGSRQNLLLVLVFTVVNLIMVLLDAGYYFLFSASVPYYLTAVLYYVDMELYGAIGALTIVALVVSACFLAVYLLCWIFSKKHIGWLTAALVLFSVDTLCLIVMAVISKDGSVLVDLAFHVWVLVSLAQGLSANSKLKQWNAAQAAYPYPDPAQQTAQQSCLNHNNGPDL